MFAGGDITYSADIITNDGFWPDISAADFAKRRAVPAEQDPGAIAAALLAATSEINLQLSGYQDTLRTAGYGTAKDVPGIGIQDGNNALTELYLCAVFARAKAAMLPEFASTTEREAANNLNERSVDARQQLLAESQQAIRAIKGKRRSGAVLI